MTISIRFNKDTMTVADLKKCTETLETILWMFERNETSLEDARNSAADHVEKVADEFTLWQEEMRETRP